MKRKILSKNKLNFTLIINGALVGLITGAFIELFEYIISGIEIFRDSFLVRSLGESNPFVIILTIILLIILALVVGQMVKREPAIGGSGIAGVKNYANQPEEIKHVKQFFYKYLGSIIVLASGLTAGKVGPSTHFGAMIGIEVGERNKLGEDYTILLVLAGIASGISAIFHAPLAGIVFVLEVITDKADEDVLTVLLSSVASSFLVVSIFSNKSILDLKGMPYLPFSHYTLVFILIIISVIFSKLFSYLLLKTFVIMEKIPIKNEFLPIFPFLITGIFYFLNTDYVGFNFNFLMGLRAEGAISIVLIYFLIRLFLTLMTFGSRVPGGLFYPVIFLGAIAGIIVFNLGDTFLALDRIYMVNFIALGIVAFITGVYKSPLTATVLILELTANFTYLLPVIFVALFVQMGTDYLDVEPVHNLLVKHKNYFENKK